MVVSRCEISDPGQQFCAIVQAQREHHGAWFETLIRHPEGFGGHGSSKTFTEQGRQRAFPAFKTRGQDVGGAGFRNGCTAWFRDRLNTHFRSRFRVPGGHIEG